MENVGTNHHLLDLRLIRSVSKISVTFHIRRFLSILAVCLAATLATTDCLAAQEGEALWYETEKINSGLEAPSKDVDRSSPRVALRSFLELIETGDLSAAVHVLNLSAIPKAEQQALGSQLASELAAIFDRKLRINWSSIPVAPDARTTDSAEGQTVSEPRRDYILEEFDVDGQVYAIRLARYAAQSPDGEVGDPMLRDRGAGTCALLRTGIPARLGAARIPVRHEPSHVTMMSMRFILCGLGIAMLAYGPAAGQTTLAMPNGFAINCALKPRQTIEISSPISGTVEKVFVRPGTDVKVGDILVQLDSDLAKADLDLAEQRAAFDSALVTAKVQEKALALRMARLKTALDRKAISANDYEDAALEHELAKANIQRQEQDLALAQSDAERARLLVAKSTIRSPADGVIGEDLVNPSETIGNQPIATLYVTESLRAEAFVPLILLDRLRSKPSFALFVNGDRTNPVAAELDYISPVANLSSNTISVFFTLNAKNILSGYKCELDLS